MRGRHFILDEGHVLIGDGLQEISFRSVAEFNRYVPSLRLDAFSYIDYRPQRAAGIDPATGTRRIIHLYRPAGADENTPLRHDRPPAIHLDTIIDAVPRIRQDVDDPYWGMTQEQRKEAKREEKIRARVRKRADDQAARERQAAIAELIAEGELPGDYQETERGRNK